MIQTDHEDYIQDVAFSYYGNYMATCGNDKKIKIYEKSKEGDFLLKKTLEVNPSNLGPRLSRLEGSMGEPRIRDNIGFMWFRQMC